jgi:hypothetical protein
VADNEMVVRVVNQVVGGAQVDLMVPGSKQPLHQVGQIGKPEISNKGSLGRTISAQFLVEAGSRLLNATGNSEISQAVSKTGRYVFLGARAIGGDPTAIATLAVDLASQALKAVMDQAKNDAQMRNDIDTARYNAGLLNLDGVKISKNFWTGRYEYSRGS